jgi:hypothetical protein
MPERSSIFNTLRQAAHKDGTGIHTADAEDGSRWFNAKLAEREN